MSPESNIYSTHTLEASSKKNGPFDILHSARDQKLEDAREHQDYRYDLNIIFPDEDEAWVLGEFLVDVQEHLPDFLRNRIVCGDDDLPLGGTRYDAIDRVIENSFKNLVIISKESVNDANYLMTLQLALAHMNDVQLENVVMVFREDIPDNQLPYLVRLFLSKNKPYFQWTEERYQQMLFWEGLTKTLRGNKKMNGLLPL
ncbi:toll-like receptor 13 [Diadema antillarum]|uniref:toll-like receptor 13 n=1 Tax=Diadema antillarum TaxID=105358 RepID=UPI003A87A0B5